MTQLILKWIVVLAALFALGPLAGTFTAGLKLEDGSQAASLLTDGSGVRGMVAGLVALGLACGLGMAAGRLISRDMGLMVAGLIVAWAAWRLGTVDRAVARTGSSSMLLVLSAEGLVLGLLATGVAMVLAATSRENRPREGIIGEFADEPGPGVRMTSANLATAGAIGLAAGAAAVWIVAFEPLKGQCVMAAVVGGIACGAASQLAATLQRFRLGVLTPMLAMAVLAAAAPLIARAVHGAGLRTAAIAGELFPLGKLGPMDWVAGALLGVPIGLAWANSMLEKEPAGAPA